MNEIKPQSGWVEQNEVLIKEKHQWLYFSKPHQIMIAQTLGDVLPALQETEKLIAAKGWYAAGFLSYEAAPAFDSSLKTRASSASCKEFPYLWFGLYPEPTPMTLARPENSKQILDWQPTADPETYHAAITKIKNAIAEGNTYQVNYTMRLQAEFTGNAWDFFLHLTQNQDKHAAYIDIGPYIICSASPELFFQLDGKTITCRPMKGTAERGRTTLEDQEQSKWLKNSQKNRAENVMIVDMIRNDLGKIAEVGSVHVTSLFETERYPTLWQMTSTVTAQTTVSLTEIFTALFPCASITGAPKVSTMKIIAELEQTLRKIYTGAIGYISPQRKASFNVAIRTALIDQECHQAQYGIGGGVVWDSSSADEYTEALLKAKGLIQQYPPFSLLETILWTPQEGFFLHEKHIERMLDSAGYFDIPISRKHIEEYLDQISLHFSGPQRVRFLLDPSGNLTYASSHFETIEDNQVLNVCLAREPIDRKNVFLFHKTTRRDVYESARRGLEMFDDVLLYNEAGELTEFTIGNLVVERNCQMLTPPILCGVLAGTFRATLIETGHVLESVVTIDQLKTCTKIFRVNSIRRWQRVEFQEQPADL